MEGSRPPRNEHPDDPRGRRTTARRPHRADLYAAAEPLGMPLGMVQTPLEYVAHPQTVARAPFVDGIASSVWNFSATPSPRLGASGDHHRRSFPSPSGAAPSLPLAGIRVVEFGVAAVVPECVWMLSELGAEVIKIESTGKMDNLRFTGLGDPNKGFAFNTEARAGWRHARPHARRGTPSGRSCASRPTSSRRTIAAG